MKTLRISKSLLLAYDAVMMGEACGVQFKSMYLDKTHRLDPTPAMMKGNRFEFLALGIKNRDGSEPEPIKTSSGNVSKAEEEKVKAQAERCKQALEKHGFEIMGTDQKKVNDFDGFQIVSVLDAEGTKDGEPVIIDTKYSGLLYNKWEVMGWHPEKIANNIFHQKQALMYMFHMAHRTGKLYDFYYLVHSATNDVESEIFKMQFSDDPDMHQKMAKEQFQIFERSLHSIAKTIRLQYDMDGFKAVPTVKGCMECPLMADGSCKHAISVPEITKVNMVIL